MHTPKAGDIYKHFKGNLYKVLAVATHTEDDEELVVYQAMYGDKKVYARPIAMFMSPVDRVKYPDVSQELRFELQSGAENATSQSETLVAADDKEDALERFLDARTHGEKLAILQEVHPLLTEQMLDTMFLSCDLEPASGDVEDKYISLKNCLLTFEKYECTRLR